MNLTTVLFGKTFAFSSVREVLAKANEEKSGDLLAGNEVEDFVLVQGKGWFHLLLHRVCCDGVTVSPMTAQNEEILTIATDVSIATINDDARHVVILSRHENTEL